MADNKQPQQQIQPRNIFEVINQNIVDLSQDVVQLYTMVEKIYTALYPPTPAAEPVASGTEKEEK